MGKWWMKASMSFIFLGARDPEQNGLSLIHLVMGIAGCLLSLIGDGTEPVLSSLLY